MLDLGLVFDFRGSGWLDPCGQEATFVGQVCGELVMVLGVHGQWVGPLICLHGGFGKWTDSPISTVSTREVP